MSDIACPYCGEKQDINHYDDYGYDCSETYEQECTKCNKTFTYTVYISYSYDAKKAQCKNGGNHNYKQNDCAPKKYTQMICEDCGERREPTEKEWEDILK